MAKIAAGAALIAGAVALDVFSAGIASGLSVAIGDTAAAVLTSGAAVAGVGSIGASLLMGGIADALKYGQGTGIAVHDQSAAAWMMVYGRQRIGGSSVDVSISGDGNRWLWMVIAHAAHPVKSMDAVYLNGQQAFVAGPTYTNGQMVSTPAGSNGLQGNLVGTSDTNPGNMGLNGMVIGIHPTDANYLEYDNFYFDGNPRFWMAQYDGTQTEADPFYIANCRYSNVNGVMTPHWNSNCVLQGTAYGIYRFWWNANWSGVPALHVDVHGKNNIYDPRLDTSPGANPTDAAYQVYTENAALVLADYLTNSQWGMKFPWSEIDMTQLVAAANVCDEMVPLANPQTINGVTITEEPRYAINGVLDSNMLPGSVVDSMLSAMGGGISFVGGQWYIWPAQYQGASGITINPTDMIGPLTFNPRKKARDLYNEVRASFVSPAAFTTTQGPGIDVYQNTSLFNNFNSQWKVTDMVPFSENPARDYAVDQWLTQDGGVKYIHNTKFPLTISHATCQRLSKIMLRRNRWQGSGTLVLPFQFYTIMPMDILEINYAPFSWSSKPIQVIGTRLSFRADDSGVKAPVFEVDFVETDPTIYEWATTDELALTPNGMSQAGPTIPLVQPPTNLVLESGATTMSVGMTLPTILCTWTTPTTTYSNGTATATPDSQVTENGHIYVEMSPDNVNWQPVATLGGAATSYVIPSLSDGSIWYVRLRAARGNGMMSEYVQAGPITVSDTTLDIAATDVYYTGGVSVQSMQPAQIGADVTADNANIQLQNPNFAAGNRGWTVTFGAASILPNGHAYGQSGYSAQFPGGTGVLANNQQIPCAEGDVLSAAGWLYGASGGSGYGNVRLTFYNGSGSEISYQDFSAVTGSGVFQQSRGTATAPAGTLYATMSFVVFLSDGSWVANGASAAYLPNSLDEINDGNTFLRPLYVASDHTFHVSSAWVPQGSFTPIIPVEFFVNWSVPSSGQATVNCSVSAGEIERPDGSFLTIPDNTTPNYNINASTTYTFYARLNNSTGELDLCGGPQSAPNNTALQLAQLDGWVYIGMVTATSPATPSSGTTTGGTNGGGSGICPDGDELVRVGGRGLVPCVQVKKGDTLEGWNFETKKPEFRVVTRVRHVESSTFVRVKGRKVSPHHPISGLDHCDWVNAVHRSESFDFTPGTRVQMSVDSSDYDDQNFLIYAPDGSPAFVMHNNQPVQKS